MAVPVQTAIVQSDRQPETESESGSLPVQENTPAPTAMAIARCRAASKRVLEAYVKVRGAKAVTSYEAEKLSASAYRNAMPALSSRENICAFIACVTDGVLIEIIQEDTSARLLYAAQVALGGLPRESHHSISTAGSGENRQPGRPRRPVTDMTTNS